MTDPDQTISNHKIITDDIKMELLDKRNNVKTEIVTYRFAVPEAARARMVKTTAFVPVRVQQIFPTVCASLSCLPFGLMLGWPSPTNPILLDQQSPIPITIDQSAMIAGFLMIGNAVGTPLSRKGFFCSKFGILVGILVMAVGWALMWQSRNIFWLLGSRFVVGFGNAYGTGQLKIYISNICDEDLKQNLIKLINIFVYLGIIVIFSFGPFIEFRETSVICMIISIVIFLILLFLPSTPVELIKANKLNDARNLISRFKPYVNVNEEIFKISESIKNKTEEHGIINLFKDPVLRVNFLIFAVLVFCQQFSGAPSTIIYTQILFRESHCQYPEYLAIAYVIVFFLCNVLAIFYISKFNKRLVLLSSTFSVILFIIAKILVIRFKLNEDYWSYTSVVVMFLFIISHTLGLGNIPFTLIPDLFPSSYRTTVTHCFIAFHSILALIITKIFQVLMSQYDVGVPFYLFLGVSTFAMCFIYFAVPSSKTENVSVANVEKNAEINGKTIN